MNTSILSIDELKQYLLDEDFICSRDSDIKVQRAFRGVLDYLCLNYSDFIKESADEYIKDSRTNEAKFLLHK